VLRIARTRRKIIQDQPRTGFADVLHKARIYVTLVLGGLIGVFALQNIGRVELTFIFWTFESRLIVVIVLSLIVGLIIGWFYGHGGVGGKTRQHM
jgi:uncharacterized integral membrane protein